jgi:Domain of unknown function (DUF1918)
MKAKVGAKIVVESERATQAARRGVIEEVLQEDPPRYRVQWDDGRQSIFSPASGVAQIEKAARGRSTARR